MTEQDGAGAEGRRRRGEQLFGAAAAPAARPARAHAEAPRSVRWAAAVVAVEAALLAGVAAVLLVLTLTGDPDSVGRALAEVAYVVLGAAVLAAAAVGLWRVSGWARGPVVVLQILLGLIGYTAAFPGGAPLIGIPLLVLVAAELYLLFTPEARLAFLDR